MTLSMADVNEWQPDKIDEVAEALAERARTGSEAARELRGLQELAKWEGEAGEAAKHAVEKSATTLETSAQNDVLTSLATKKSAADVRIVRNSLKSIVDYAAAKPAVPINLETNTVTMPDTTGWDDEDVKNLKNKVADLEDRIGPMLAAAQDADGDLGRLMKAAAGEDSKTPAEQGRYDGAYVQGGTIWEKGVLDRLEAAGTLSNANLDRLARGEKVQIGADQMAYLYQMARSFDGKSLAEIKSEMAGMPSEAQAALSQGLKLVSNPNVEVVGAGELKKTAVAATDDTRDTFVPVTGSLVNLPDEMVKELTRTDRVTHEPSRGFATTHLNGIGALQDVSDILKPGADAYSNGSEATKSMMTAATQYAAVDIRYHEGWVHGLESDARGSLTGALADVYRTAGSDHVGVRDMVTGSGGGDFLRTVTHEQWGDQSTKVGEAFSWMHESGNPVAIQTASEVAHWLSDNKIELNSLDGTEKLFVPGGDAKSFAEVNPGLAKAMAEGVSPYLADFAQATPDSGLTHSGIESFKNGNEFKDLFSVFDKHADAAGVINNAAYQQYQQLIENAAHPGLHGTQAEVAGRLTNAMADGAVDSVRPGSSSDEDMIKGIYKQIPGLDRVFDLAEAIEKGQDAPPPNEFAQKLATIGTGSIGFQSSVLNGMIEAHPEIANDPALKSYITDGRIDLSNVSDEDMNIVGRTFANYFNLKLGPASVVYDVDLDSFASEVARGNNDDWIGQR